MTATDKTTEMVADVAEEVSDQALHLAEASREASGRGLGLAFGAFLVGAGVGGGFAYIFTKRRLETKYSQLADAEIAEMREHYQAKARAMESEAAKRPVEDIVKERGYSSPAAEPVSPPMAVQPPAPLVEEEKQSETPEPEVRNIFKERDAQEAEVPPVEHEWNYHEELRRRSPDEPYVIHYDERDEMDYQVVTLTYYDGDDVMCDERDTVIDEEERNRLVGESNLNRFGHGSNDPSVVYVRNDKLELVYEVVKSPNNYAEEVHGFSHDSYSRNLERMRTRERDDAEE